MRALSTERLYLANPYNRNHLNLIQSFEKEHDITSSASTFIGEICTKFSEEEYEQRKKQDNEINEIIFIESNSKIKDLCQIQGEKDVKICYVTFAPIKVSKKRQLVTLATDYAMNTLHMQEVFMRILPEDRSMLQILTNQGFENLGEDRGTIIFLKDYVEELTPKRKAQ